MQCLSEQLSFSSSGEDICKMRSSYLWYFMLLLWDLIFVGGGCPYDLDDRFGLPITADAVKLSHEPSSEASDVTFQILSL